MLYSFVDLAKAGNKIYYKDHIISY